MVRLSSIPLTSTLSHDAERLVKHRRANPGMTHGGYVIAGRGSTLLTLGWRGWRFVRRGQRLGSVVPPAQGRCVGLGPVMSSHMEQRPRTPAIPWWVNTTHPAMRTATVTPVRARGARATIRAR